MSANVVLIDQDIACFRDAKAASPFKVVNLLLTLRFNNANQITRHTGEWDHDREMTTDGGFLGMLKEHRKRTTLIDV